MSKDREYYKSIYDLKTWLSIHVNQLSYTRNLVITLSIAALGFWIDRYLTIKPQLSGCSKISWGIVGGCLLLSIFMGLYISEREAESYRLNRQISRRIEELPDFTDQDTEYKDAHQKVKTIKERNENLFIGQLVTFFIAITIFSILIFV